MKTLEDEQYVVIKAYKFTVFEIWRDFNVLPYIACPRYPYIRVYQLYDKAMNIFCHGGTCSKCVERKTSLYCLGG